MTSTNNSINFQISYESFSGCLDIFDINFSLFIETNKVFIIDLSHNEGKDQDFREDIGKQLCNAFYSKQSKHGPVLKIY